jgi:hypothetical protein
MRVWPLLLRIVSHLNVYHASSWSLCVLFFLIFSFPAGASLPAVQPILERVDPVVTPRGWQTGHVLFLPHIIMAQSYSDNLRASYNNRCSDFITEIIPALRIVMDKNTYGMTADTRIQQKSYLRTSAENNTNASVKLRPYYNVSRALNLKGHLAYSRQHELRTADTGNPLAKGPTPFDQGTTGLSLRYKPGRTAARLFIDHDRLAYHNVDLLAGGRFINDDRNHAITTAGAELSCDITHQLRIGWQNEKLWHAYTRADYNILSGLYDGLNRDSNGWRSQLNFYLKPTALLDLSGYTGIEKRTFDYTLWPNKVTPVGQFKLRYLFTPLTNLTLQLERRITDTGFDNTPAFTQQQIKVGIAHELRRNLIVTWDSGYGQATYWNHERQDKLYGSALAFTYKQNRFLHWQAAYRYQKRDSMLQEASYHENIVTIGAQVQF